MRFAFADDLRELYKSFGVNLPDNNGDDSWTLPMPARYVIGKDGKVAWASVHPDYRTRPEVEDTLAALSAL